MGGGIVPKYLWKVSYTAEGAKGVLKEGGSSRRDMVAKMSKDMGGSMDAFYFAFGEDDVYVIAEAPDNATAAAISMAVGAGGAATIETVVLLSPEEIDEAAKKTVPYRAPRA
jgi:uncharacterized protein with GYD domain